MNWLAHLYLSEPNAAFRIGNLLPDFARPAVLESLPEEILCGVRRHRRIDAFTDCHPLVRQSASRIEPPLRRFAPIIVDLFYDHFLTRDWLLYSPIPLGDFVGEVYASIEDFRQYLPPEIYERLVGMREGNWLNSYGSFTGLADALGRIGCRLRRPVDLAVAVETLERNYAAFHADFRAFFPQLRARVSV